MLEDRDIIKGKIKINNAEHDISLYFDRVYKEWIQRLLSLIQKIEYEQNRYALCSLQCNNDFLEQPEYSFLGTSCTAINQFLYLLIKDELSEITGNFALPYLCKNIANGEFGVDYNFSIEYTKGLVRNDFDSVLAPSFLDTYVGVWSCFEDAINSITKKDESLINNELANSNFKKYKKFIKKILFSDGENDLLSDRIDTILDQKKEDIIKENPIYISFPDRMNYLFKKIKEQYRRDIKQDKNTLLFLGALRNTVHNNGRHLKKDMEIKLGGKVFQLRKDEGVYFDHHIDSVILINELFDIYCEILRYVTQQKIIESNELLE